MIDNTIALDDMRSPLALPFVLRADAVITGATGLLMLIAAPWLDGLLDLPVALLAIAGAIVIPYAAWLVALARQPRPTDAAIRACVAINIAWAIGCVAVLISDAVSPNALGVAFIGLNIAAVLLFAVLQEVALRNRS